MTELLKSSRCQWSMAPTYKNSLFNSTNWKIRQSIQINQDQDLHHQPQGIKSITQIDLHLLICSIHLANQSTIVEENTLQHRHTGIKSIKQQAQPTMCNLSVKLDHIMKFHQDMLRLPTPILSIITILKQTTTRMLVQLPNSMMALLQNIE